MQQLASYLSGAGRPAGAAPVLSITPSPARRWEVTSEGRIWRRRAASRLSAVVKPCRR